MDGASRSLLGKRYHIPGTAPGTLRAPEEARTTSVRVTVMDYGPDHLVEREVHDIAEILPFCDTESVTWINVEGLSDIPFLERLGHAFGLHPLTLEDVLNCGQRPKIENYSTYEFVVMKSFDVVDGSLESEQISIVFGANFVLTLQEVPGDSFDQVRERIRHGKGRIRRMGPDYLTYALSDALIDEFFPVLEHYGEQIERLEDELLERPTPRILPEIHEIKRDLLVLRRAVWPERELLNVMMRDDSPMIHRRPGLPARLLRPRRAGDGHDRDLSRAGRRACSTCTSRAVSNRMNEVMKVLTIIATIFIPLTFIAGIYGMNFDPDASPWNMPELRWYYGYPFSLAVMAAVAVALVLYFRKKGWF